MQNEKLEFLGGLTAQQFLQEYWQKKPLFVKGAFKDFVNPIEADELAGLACEENVVSRIVSGNGSPKNWKLQHGPFNEKELTSLPDKNWTLLVQQVDQWSEEVAALKRPFAFLPAWRSDDVMVSFAVDHGSVGPHMDNYDVFLIQGMGKRLWKIGAEQISEEILLEDVDVKILAEYKTDHEWLVEEGDLLYIPPKIVHYGIAQGACMTYSIGYRAPNLYEMLTAYIESAKEDLENIFYEDAQLKLQNHTGEITPAAIDKVHRLLSQLPVAKENVAHWFGNLVTENRRMVEDSKLEIPFEDSENFLEELQDAGQICFYEQVRTSYVLLEDEQIAFFAQGAEYIFSTNWLPFVQQVCAKVPVELDHLVLDLRDEEAVELLMMMANEGILYLPE